MKPLLMLGIDAPVTGAFKALYRNDRGELYEHPGIDQPAPVGTSVRLPAAGNWTIYPDGTYGDGSFGCCCVLDIPGTLYWVVLAHLQNQASKSGTGKAGDVVGKVGLTGLTDGAHLHTGLSEEHQATFAHNRRVDGAGIYRIGSDSPLRDPLQYLEVQSPRPAELTLDDVAGSLNNLNAVVISNRADELAHRAEVARRFDRIDSQLDRFDGLLDRIAKAITEGRE